MTSVDRVITGDECVVNGDVLDVSHLLLDASSGVKNVIIFSQDWDRLNSVNSRKPSCLLKRMHC